MDIALEVEKNEIIRRILNVDNIDVLNRIKRLLHSEDMEGCILEEDATIYLTKSEVLSRFDDACKEMKEVREGKLKGTPLNEFLDEL